MNTLCRPLSLLAAGRGETPAAEAVRARDGPSAAPAARLDGPARAQRPKPPASEVPSRGRRGSGWGGVIGSSTSQCEAEGHRGAPLWLPSLRAGGAGLAGPDRFGGVDEARGGAWTRSRDPGAVDPVPAPSLHTFSCELDVVVTGVGKGIPECHGFVRGHGRGVLVVGAGLFCVPLGGMRSWDGRVC